MLKLTTRAPHLLARQRRDAGRHPSGSHQGCSGHATRSPFMLRPRCRTLRALSCSDPFHNAKTGLCFPSYEKIAEAACCARSTVAQGIKALEDAGILSWVNRLKRVSGAAGLDLFGHRIRKTRVIRTSNGYHFIDPKGGQTPVSSGTSSKSDFPSGTPIQKSLLLKSPPASRVLNPDNPLEDALIHLARALGAAV